jgi:ABC-type branched-subunit amino acid transport system ATPase component/ABC-type branched-subunit amino acid transport system permease subunit
VRPTVSLLWRGGVLAPRADRIAAAVGIVALAGYPLVQPAATYYHTVLLLAFLLAIQAISWNIISGYAGYVSLGHSAFLGLGAYTAGLLSIHLEVNPLLLAPLGGVVAVVVALCVGVVVLRAKGHAFVIITIALLLAMQVIATNFAALTRGSDGITLELPFWSRDIQNIPFYYIFLFLMLVTFGFSAWIRRTKFGTGLVAIRDDEGKAAAVGINTTLYKVLAYAASTLFIGVAGAVYGYFLTFLSPTGAFAILPSVSIVLSALAGGRGTLYGPLVGAFIVQFASEAATVYGGGERARLLLFGLALACIVLFLPEGLLPTARRLLARRRAAGTSVEFIDLPATSAAGATTAAASAAGATPAGAAPAAAVGTGARSVTERASEVHPRPARPGGPPRLLDIQDVRIRFGGLQALDGVHLAVGHGSVTGLIGPNGSGKTTLFNVVSGTMSADAGTIRLDGRPIDRRGPWARAHLGIGRTFQVTRLFASMTVLENVVAPLPSFSWRALAAGAVAGQEARRARELLAFVGLQNFGDVRAGALSFGQRKLVELAQVLMLRPRLILLDEPAGGVNPALVERLGELIRSLNREGVTFLVVEHNIPFVLDLCDRVAVLSRGKILAEGPPELVRSAPAVLDAYLGRDQHGEETPETAGGEEHKRNSVSDKKARNER